MRRARVLALIVVAGFTVVTLAAQSQRAWTLRL